MIIMGGHAIMNGQMTLGDLIMYLLFTGMLASPVIQIASIGTSITEAFAGLDRIAEIKQTVTEDADDASRGSIDRVHGTVAFDDVWFEYTPNTPVLKGVSFEAPAGSTTALVGSSGSGKSTLVSLVMAFNRPTAGTLRIDGRDLGTLRLADYRSQLGIVLQDNFLFDGTIADNIRYGNPHATLEQVRDVSRIAHCDEFIEEFKDKYDTVVGERGIRLSGGQRQRVAIARAILADPRILILDEATSSLDSESEAKIQDALRALRRGRTTFVIAHRLSTIRTANQILVLEAGEIVERGTHQRAARAQRPLPSAARPPVQLRTGSLRQSGRRLHARRRSRRTGRRRPAACRLCDSGVERHDMPVPPYAGAGATVQLWPLGSAARAAGSLVRSRGR